MTTDTRPATPRTARAPSSGAVWGLAPGVHTHGEVGGSGLKDASYLVERGDGQMMQVSELLYLVLREAELPRPAPELAAAITAASGRTLSTEGLEHLLETKLESLGLVRDVTRAVPTGQGVARADPLLSLRLKGTIVPARVVRPLARALTFVYWQPVIVAALAALIAMDVVLLRRGDAVTALGEVLATPTMLLMLYALFTLGALIHEFGHAVGCRAGGAEPGAIGVGLYILFPAFYTDVTQSYRLGRGGRLRTDLGGLYFNVWCLLAAGVGFLTTGEPVLLIVVVLMHIEMAQQLVPAIRLDGYFVLADLAGVPDLFSRVRPILRSMRPGAAPEPRVTELKPRARRIITAWVLFVVPTLVIGFGWLILNLPFIISTAVGGVVAQAQGLVLAWENRELVGLALGAVSLVILAVPLLGIAFVLPKILVTPLRWLLSRRAAGGRCRGPGVARTKRGRLRR